MSGLRSEPLASLSGLGPRLENDATLSSLSVAATEMTSGYEPGAPNGARRADQLPAAKIGSMPAARNDCISVWKVVELAVVGAPGVGDDVRRLRRIGVLAVGVSRREHPLEALHDALERAGPDAVRILEPISFAPGATPGGRVALSCTAGDRASDVRAVLVVVVGILAEPLGRVEEVVVVVHRAVGVGAAVGSFRAPGD